MTIALGLTAALLWALTDVASQRVTRRTGALSAGFWIVLGGCPIAIVVALAIDGIPTAHSLDGIGWAALAGVVDAGAVLLLMRALDHGDLAIIGPLTALEGAFASLGSVLVLGETISALGAAALVAAAGGGALAAARSPRVRAPGATPAVIAALMFAVVLLLMSRATGAGAITIVAVTRCVSALTLAPIAIAGQAGRLAPSALLAAGMTATLDVGGFAIYVLAARRGPFSVAVITSTQFATFAAIIGIVLLDERPRRHQLAGIALTLVGVSLLSST